MSTVRRAVGSGCSGSNDGRRRRDAKRGEQVTLSVTLANESGSLRASRQIRVGSWLQQPCEVTAVRPAWSRGLARAPGIACASRALSEYLSKPCCRSTLSRPLCRPLILSVPVCLHSARNRLRSVDSASPVPAVSGGRTLLSSPSPRRLVLGPRQRPPALAGASAFRNSLPLVARPFTGNHRHRTDESAFCSPRLQSRGCRALIVMYRSRA